MTNDKNVTVARGPSTRRPGPVWLFALPLAGALALSAGAYAGPGHAGGPHEFGGAGFGMGRGHQLERLDKVNATDAQKAQIKAAWDAAGPQLKTLREEHMKVREELKAALAAPNIDTAKIEGLRRKSMELFDKTSTVTTKAIVTSAQILTPEQRQKLATMRQEHQGRHGHKGGRPQQQPKAE